LQPTHVVSEAAKAGYGSPLLLSLVDKKQYRPMLTIEELIKTATEAALEAGNAIMDIYRSGEFEKELKSDESPITKADKASHAIIVRQLAETKLPVLSEESSQKDWNERKNRNVFWLVDPLDGTKEFINKNGEFTVNIALIEHGKPVAGVIYAPCQDILYSGSKETGIFKTEGGKKTKIRPRAKRPQFNDLLQQARVTVVASRSHLSEETKTFIQQFKNVKLDLSGSSLKFMSLLENRADIYPRLAPTMEWDTASAHAILNAANRGIYETGLKSELVYNKPDLTNPSFIAF
jgi:3'(2'), 5'-bisphosphate nucleotidase